MGKWNKLSQIEYIYDIYNYLFIFIRNSRKYHDGTKPFSIRKYYQTTIGETKKIISNRKYLYKYNNSFNYI